MIGSNVGGSPDVLADVLAGELGYRFYDDFAVQWPTRQTAAVARTMFFDELITKAVEGGCQQLVLLACGLDTRAWRLPSLVDATVFEVDVPACHEYKTQTLAKLADTPPHACRRVVVAADLSDSSWEQKLLSAGFDPSARSFFLVEGLLMYLPSARVVDSFLGQIARLACPGSLLSGDCFCGAPPLAEVNRVLHRYGAHVAFDAGSRSGLEAALARAGLTLTDARSVYTYQAAGVAEGETDEGEKGYLTFVAEQPA